MALTFSSPAGWPLVDGFTSGSANVLTLVTLPRCPFPLLVSVRPTTNAGKLVGQNKNIADGDALGSTTFAPLDAGQWSSFVVPGDPEGKYSMPSFGLTSATGSTVFAVTVEPWLGQ